MYSFTIIDLSIVVAMEMAGKLAETTRASYQPQINPIRKPKKVVEMVIKKVGTLSPIAFAMVVVSEATLVASSLGLI